MTELLDRHAGDPCRHVSLASALDCAAFERCQELCVEAVVAALYAIMCGRWLRVAHQFLAELLCKQPLTNLLARRGQIERNGDISVEGSQGFIIERLRQRMQAVKTVRPAANDDDAVEPRFESFDQTGEIVRFGYAGQLQRAEKRLEVTGIKNSPVPQSSLTKFSAPA